MQQLTEEYYNQTVKEVNKFYFNAKLVTSIVAIGIIAGVLQANMAYFIEHPFLMTLCTGAGIITAMFLATIVRIINDEIKIFKKVDMKLMADWFKDFSNTISKLDKESGKQLSEKDFDELWHRFVLDIVNRVYKESNTNDSD